MKYTIKILCLFLFFTSSGMTLKSSDTSIMSHTADKIIGDWQPSNKRSVIRIYKGVKVNGESPDKYYGKVV